MTELGPVQGPFKVAASLLATIIRHVVRAPFVLVRAVVLAPLALWRLLRGAREHTAPSGGGPARPGDRLRGDRRRWHDWIGLIFGWRGRWRLGGQAADGLGSGYSLRPLPEVPPNRGNEFTAEDGGSQSHGVERLPDEEHLESLKRGGFVRFGGTYMMLAYVRHIGIDSVMAAAFVSGTKRAPGLLHVTLDEILRVTVRARRRRPDRERPWARIRWRVPVVRHRTAKPAPALLDPRFDVVLSRRGPAVIEHDDDDREARRKREANRPSGGVQGALPVPRVESDSPLFDGAGALARQGQSWLGERLAPVRSSGYRARRVRALLRQRTFVRLEEGNVLCVSFRRPIRDGAARELETLLTSLNTPPAYTIGWMSFPIRFVTRSGWRRTP